MIILIYIIYDLNVEITEMPMKFFKNLISCQFNFVPNFLKGTKGQDRTRRSYDQINTFNLKLDK